MARKRGRGVAACWYGIARTATVDRAGAWAEIDDGGTAKVVTGVTEIGEGILTVLAQITAHEIGIRPEDVTIGDNDTARSPEAAHAGATRQTYMIGNAVALAARQARAKLADVIADHWNVDAGQIHAAAGEIWAEGTNHRIPMREAVHIAKSKGVVPLGSASFGTDTTGLDPVDGSGRPWQAYVFGCQVAEVEVDTVTGEVQVLGIWAVHDVGRAVNPQGVEGQIEGGVVQALGQGLMEDYKLSEGRTTTPGFAKYILPTSLDVPQITSVILEDPDPIGPLGVKGIGEPAMIPTIPAVMNAIYDAVGVRIFELPATPEKVLMAIKQKSPPAVAWRRNDNIAVGRLALNDLAQRAANGAAPAKESVFRAELSEIRRLSTILPGPLPTGVNGIRVAASVRPRKFVIAGGDESPVSMPRTAFQVVYPDCTVMIDSGLDKATHDSFSPDKPEPYFAENFVKLRRALHSARLIVLTHFHADHVAGVLTAPNFRELSGKTLISYTAGCLMNTPHRTHLRLTQPQVDFFVQIDYPLYYPVAPGLVLIKSPGHSVDSQMVYIRLQSGTEILHSVDAAWVLDNILQEKGKAAPWVKEDVSAIMGQLRWLKRIHENEKNLTILVTHDDILFDRVTRGGVVGADLKV